MSIRAVIAGALLALILGLAGALWWQSGRMDALQADNAALRASVASLRMERDLAREARAVADARRQASEAKAAEYDALREGLLRDENDADLPDWLRDYLGRLLGGSDDEAGQPGNPE